MECNLRWYCLLPTETGTIVIDDVSALSYSWTTSQFIQTDSTRYVTSETSGSVTITGSITINLAYQTQYLVTYATTGNVLPITSPADEWVKSGSTATRLFQPQVVNEADNGVFTQQTNKLCTKRTL